MLKTAAKALYLAAVLIVGATPGAVAQAQTPPAVLGTPRVYSETFDGPDQSLILGGQINFGDRGKSVWAVIVSGGKLVMENRQDPRSLHYNDISWVRFPGENLVESTGNMTISAVVESQNTGTGGAGILFGSGKSGQYLMFGVDGEGRFHVLQKDGKKLMSVHSATHPAIEVHAPNTLTFARRADTIAFYANGTEVIQIPVSERVLGSRGRSGQSGIGVAAFGAGTYSFDEIEITGPR